MTLTRLESFPFDSRYDGFDDEGYPVYDRAVGAKTMRDVFAHFFSDGVFSDTTYPFRLTKAASGLAVTVNPGVIIINGGWGILPEATTLTLATGTTAGVIKYAVFARYDNNDEHRTLYLRTDASSAGGAVPEPSTTEANVTEYRIGYITVPSNSTNLGNATITNEVGTSKCPYAVPLFDIDAAEVLEDLRNDAQAAYDKYYALLQSAVDDTTAGYLQNQINELRENQFTAEDIDPIAIREGMGLGNTGGVLQPEYGGTGQTSLEKLHPEFSYVYDINVDIDVEDGYISGDYYLPTLTTVGLFGNVSDNDVPWFATKTSDGLLEVSITGLYLYYVDLKATLLSHRNTTTIIGTLDVKIGYGEAVSSTSSAYTYVSKSSPTVGTAYAISEKTDASFNGESPTISAEGSKFGSASIKLFTNSSYESKGGVVRITGKIGLKKL